MISKPKGRLFYGWVIVVALFAIGTSIWGIRFTFGVFFNSIESEFDLTRMATSTVFSVNMILSGVFTIMFGWVLDRYGPKVVFLIMGIFTGLSLILTSQINSFWQLYITYSFLLAIGVSPIYIGIMSTVSRWFDKKRGVALGIASTGAGLGPLITAPFATFLIERFNWRTAYLIIGIISWLLVIPLSRILKRDPYEINELPDGANTPLDDTKTEEGTLPAHLSLTQALQTGSFWSIISIYFLFSSSLWLALTHIVPHAVDIGYSSVEAATILSVSGGAVVVGRMLFGIISDRFGRKSAVLSCTLLQFSAMLWLLWAKELWMLFLFAVLLGLAWGGMGTAMAALIGDTFGLGNLGAILGVLDVGFTTGAALGPIISGFIFDVSGSYYQAFLLAVASTLLATILVSFIKKERKVI